MARLVDSSGDPAIPALASVLDPTELAKQLSLPSFAKWHWDTSHGIKLQVLKWWRASRCTFEITVRTSSGWQELIGKVYAKDRSDILQAMEEICQAGFSCEQEFAIPRPIAFLKPLCLLLYEKVPGTRAKTVFLHGNQSDHVQAAERCARWLTRFQVLAPLSGRVFALHDHLANLERAARGLAELGGPIADKASWLLRQLNSRTIGLTSTELSPGHGTYTPGQVVLAEGRTVTIDWDTYNLSDPAHDVARFLVELRRLGLKYFGSIHALDKAAEVFGNTYVALGRSDITTRLPFHEAAICLERANNDVDKQARGWRERAEIMLDEGLRILQGAR
jgi:aminoglycoside phosphotransferase (APT) family kinase protein